MWPSSVAECKGLKLFCALKPHLQKISLNIATCESYWQEKGQTPRFDQFSTSDKMIYQDLTSFNTWAEESYRKLAKRCRVELVIKKSCR